MRNKPGPKPKIKIEPIRSSEWQEWHLMPDGWIEGTQKLDCMPKRWMVEPPPGRLLTCRIGDKLKTVFDAPQFYIEEKWRSLRTEELATAVARHGRWPPDFRAETLAPRRPGWLEDVCFPSAPA